MKLGKDAWLWIVGAALIIAAWVWLRQEKQNSGDGAHPMGAGLLGLFPGGSAGLNQAVIEKKFADLSTYAGAVGDAVKKNPLLGTILGLTPQQTDYITLDPEHYSSRYGFQPWPGGGGQKNGGGTL